MASFRMDRFRRLPRTRILDLEVPVATTRIARLIGLALLAAERAPDGLLIPGCRSVHTFGMRFAIDLVFLGTDAEVLEVRRRVPPNRFARCPTAAAVLELRGRVSPPRRGY